MGLPTVRLLFWSTSKLFSATILVSLFFVWVLIRARERKQVLPPGTEFILDSPQNPSNVIVGPNKVHFWGTTYVKPPPQEPWKAYERWSKEFRSPLIYLRLRGRHVVVLNKIHSAIELLEKRWNNYSSRPDFPMVDLIGRQNNVGFQRYGPKLRYCRKVLHEVIGSRVRDQWGPLVDGQTIILLGNLLDSPHEYETILHGFVASFIVQFAYGQDADEDYVHLAEITAAHTTEAMKPGRWLVDSYPLLKYLPAWAPGGGFQTWAAEANSKFQEFTQVPFNRVKKEVESGSVRSSFVHNQLSKGDRTPGSEATLAGIAASLFSAGTDTMATVLLTFFLMMLHYPEVQERAYQEISSVVGSDRLPSLEDSSRLPFIEALIKEIHRFQPAVPLMPRSPESDDYFDGFRIPRKSWLFTNIWAMTHDEDEYQDPGAFNPDRFILQDKLQTSPRDPRDMTFGFGRRRCPGVVLANAALFSAISRIIACFTIVPTKDDEGMIQLPPLEFITAFTSCPKPFKCIVVSRSRASSELVRQSRLNQDLEREPS